jgi:hypothetical protein
VEHSVLVRCDAVFSDEKFLTFRKIVLPSSFLNCLSVKMAAIFFRTTRPACLATGRYNSKRPEYSFRSLLTDKLALVIGIFISLCLHFLGAFTKLLNDLISFVTSVRPCETTRLPLNVFSRNQSTFRKSVEKIQVSLKSDNIQWALNMKIYVHLTEYVSKICRKNSSFFKI